MAPEPQIDPDALSERLSALPGVPELRAAAGEEPVYLVGGAVRDLLLGRTADTDLDVVVEGEARPLAEALGGEITEHERFSTAAVQLGDHEIDIARARAETYERPGALPDVRPAGIEEDLARRDFTINAIALPIAGGELIDPHGGLADLRAGILRVLHPASFADDPTRAIRAARYAARLGFRLDPETERLLGEADLSTVSDDRVIAELALIADEERPSEALELIADWGVMDLGTGPKLAAALERLFDTAPEWREFADRGTAVLLAVAPGEHPELLRHRGAKVAHHSVPASPAEVQVLAHGHVPEVLSMARAAGAEWLDDYVRRLRHVELEISGLDLIESGIPEGPAVGAGLNAALAARLNGELQGYDAELDVALDAAEATLAD